MGQQQDQPAECAEAGAADRGTHSVCARCTHTRIHVERADDKDREANVGRKSPRSEIIRNLFVYQGLVGAAVAPPAKFTIKQLYNARLIK